MFMDRVEIGSESEEESKVTISEAKESEMETS